jgi:hypothetical protein
MCSWRHPDRAGWRILYGRRSATLRRIAPLHLIAVILIVAGLAVSAPPACLCAPDDHFGLLLHPMFPHAHGAVHQGWEAEASAPDSVAPGAVDQAPGISAQASDGGARDAIAGPLLPLLLAALFVEIGRRIYLNQPPPHGRTTSPPTPPPRLVPAVS